MKMALKKDVKGVVCYTTKIFFTIKRASFPDGIGSSTLL